jgi:hypothetical protein
VPARELTITGPGGRSLRVRENGDLGGVPVIGRIGDGHAWLLEHY